MEGQEHTCTHTHNTFFRSIFTCTTWSVHGPENSIYWKCDKCRQIIMGFSTGVEVLHFMSMTCQVELSAINAINQYSWQLLLLLLLNNSQLTPPICLTFTSSDTHAPDWGLHTVTHTHKHIHAYIHTPSHTQICAVCECSTTVLRMMGCPASGSNEFISSVSITEGQLQWLCHNRMDTRRPHISSTAKTSYPCSEGGINAKLWHPFL